MIASAADLRSTRAEWRTARRLYAIYSGVVAHFDVGVPPCPDLECPIDKPDANVRTRVRNWLNLMDSHCPVAFLRQVLQRDPVSTDANLLTLIRRHLERPYKTDLDREKLDFLFVQYFAHRVANHMSPEELTTTEVARVLEPVLGHWSGTTPYWLKELDALVDDVSKCHCMQDLEDYKVLERGRDLKSSVGPRFYEPIALIAFTRYNIILRRAFFYTMRADLDVVRLNLARLEKLGVKSVDGTRAGLSDRESLDSARRICQEWRSIFRTDYSAGHVSRSVKELRACTTHAYDEAKRKYLEELTRRSSYEKQLRAQAAAESEHPNEAARIRSKLPLDRSVSDQELDRALSVFEEAPENTVERAYPELTVDSDPISGAPARFRIPDVTARIQEQLAAATANHAQALSVRLDNSAICIAWWESNAFLSKENGAHSDLQTSVAARLILQEAFDDFQDGFSNDLPIALTIAHAEAGRTQEKIAEARDARDIDTIVPLAATAKRLLELIQEAEYAWNEEKA
ncbi:MAG TPA: hypothetical protein VGL89_12245 [Candidatus Koribacter sp.]|jgi:hypothetical protein